MIATMYKDQYLCEHAPFHASTCTGHKCSSSLLYVYLM